MTDPSGDPYYFTPPPPTRPYGAPPGYRPGPPPAAYQPGPPPGYQPGPPPYLAPEPGPPLAAPGRRLLARIVDTLIVSLITSVVSIPWMLPFLRYLIAQAEVAATAAQNGQAVPPPLYDAEMARFVLTLLLLSLVVSFLYEVPQLALWGRTIGKRAFGIRVVRRSDLGPVGAAQAAMRWVVQGGVTALPWVGSLFWLFDSLWLLWDRPWRQCLHDKAAGTVVLRATPFE